MKAFAAVSVFIVVFSVVLGMGVAVGQIGPIYPPAVSAPSSDRVNLPWGWYGPYNNNEWATVSQVGDPSGNWLASRAGMSLGFQCFGRERTDGKLECLVLIQGKQDERTRDLPFPHSLAGEVTIHIRNYAAAPGRDDGQFIPIAMLRHDYGILYGQCFGKCPE